MNLAERNPHSPHAQLDDIGDMLVQAGLLTREAVERHGVRGALKRAMEPPEVVQSAPYYIYDFSSLNGAEHVRALLGFIDDFGGSARDLDGYAASIEAARSWLSGLDPERSEGAPENGSGPASGDGER